MSASASDSAVPNPLYPTANHPFYPPSLVFPDYRENTLHPIYLLLIFFGALSVWLLFAATVARKLTKGRITGKEMAWVQWYAASSIIHLTFEGYFGLFHRSMAHSLHVEAQMWKMYSLADSRYIASDTFTVLMESCTAIFWGPLSFALAFWMIPKQSPFRHPVQLIVSLGQLYGLVLYYGIPMIDEYVKGPIAAVSRPEWIYYWGEFIGLNAPWFFIPALAMYHSVKEIAAAFRVSGQVDGKAITSGAVNGKKRQ